MLHLFPDWQLSCVSVIKTNFILLRIFQSVCNKLIFFSRFFFFFARMISGLIAYKMWKEVTPKGAGLVRLPEPSQRGEFLKTKTRHHHFSASLSALSSDYRRNPEKLNRNPNMSVCGEMILWSFVFLLTGKTEKMFLFLLMTDLWSCAFAHSLLLCLQTVSKSTNVLNLRNDSNHVDLITMWNKLILSHGGLTIVSKSSKLLEGKGEGFLN